MIATIALLRCIEDVLAHPEHGINYYIDALEPLSGDDRPAHIVGFRNAVRRDTRVRNPASDLLPLLLIGRAQELTTYNPDSVAGYRDGEETVLIAVCGKVIDHDTLIRDALYTEQAIVDCIQHELLAADKFDIVGRLDRITITQAVRLTMPPIDIEVEGVDVLCTVAYTFSLRDTRP